MATVAPVIPIQQGATYQLKFTAVTEAGGIFDGTGWSPFFQIRKNYADSASAEADVLLTLTASRFSYTPIAGATPGFWLAEITPTEARALPTTGNFTISNATGHAYGFELENASGQKIRGAQGVVTVSPEVAREQGDTD